MKRYLLLFILPIMSALSSPSATDFLDLSTTSNVDYEALQELGLTEDIEFNELVQFLKDFKSQLELRYGVTIEISDAINLAKNAILSSSEFSLDEKSTIISYYDLLFNKFRSQEQDIWSFGNKKKKPSFELPGKLAVGFVCCLSGALLCIVPFPVIQGAGVGLITTGISFTMDGLSNGEKPYYVDPITGKRI